MNIQDFIAIATTTPSADNCQPWSFTEEPEQLICNYFYRSKGNDLFGPFGHASLISAGAMHENLSQLTANAPLQGGTVDRSILGNNWSLSVPNKSIANISTNALIDTIRYRHTNRHPFKQLTHPLPVLSIQPNNCRITIIRDREAITSLSASLQLCSEGRFNDQELHEWLFSSIRWNESEAKTGTGLDISTLNLPPGGRQLMRWIAPWERMKLLNRFGIYKLLAYADSALFRQAPMIIAFSGGSLENDIWEAGRSIQKTWLDLNQIGIAVHPYYAITDLGNRLRSARLHPNWINRVARAQDSVRELLNLQPDEQIHMLFRIGLPTCKPIRSRRLPADSFLRL